MKRTNTTLWFIAIVVLALAVAAGPAAARTQISSSDPVSSDQVSSDPGVPFRVHAQGTTPDRTASPEATTVVKKSSGFEWDDALVGALAALGLVSISMVTVRAMRRHHRLTVESRA